MSKGLTSNSTLYKSFRGRFWQSTEGSQLAAEIGFNPSRTTPLCYNMNCRQPRTATNHSVRVPEWQKTQSVGPINCLEHRVTTKPFHEDVAKQQEYTSQLKAFTSSGPKRQDKHIDSDPYAVLSLEAVAYSSRCNTVEWFWWDWSLSQRPTGFLQCFDAVGWVMWPVKIVPEMTYKVSSGMLSIYTFTHSLKRTNVSKHDSTSRLYMAPGSAQYPQVPINHSSTDKGWR